MAVSPLSFKFLLFFRHQLPTKKSVMLLKEKPSPSLIASCKISRLWASLKNNLFYQISIKLWRMSIAPLCFIASIFIYSFNENIDWRRHLLRNRFEKARLARVFPSQCHGRGKYRMKRDFLHNSSSTYLSPQLESIKSLDGSTDIEIRLHFETRTT